MPDEHDNTVNVAKPGFVVVYSDELDVQSIMGADDDCEGAICWSPDKPIVFASRSQARDAIRISRQYAKLRKAQGLVHNDDFIEANPAIRILPLAAYTPPSKG
ncbi:MAG: hypothetical protein AAGI37_17825 [Planctomycetota bacterium]